MDRLARLIRTNNHDAMSGRAWCFAFGIDPSSEVANDIYRDMVRMVNIGVENKAPLKVNDLISAMQRNYGADSKTWQTRIKLAEDKDLIYRTLNPNDKRSKILVTTERSVESIKKFAKLKAHIDIEVQRQLAQIGDSYIPDGELPEEIKVNVLDWLDPEEDEE